MSIPKVFVSYSHDSLEHKMWVQDLCKRLINNGIDVAVDQWDLEPGDDLPSFMERNLRECDRVLMICTDNYVDKANTGRGGVGYEKMIVTSDLLANIETKKFIPLIRQAGTNNVPTFLRSKLYLDFSRQDDFEFSFDELVRTIHNAPLFVKPKVGQNPFKSVADAPVEKSGSALLELMALLVDDYERGKDYSLYKGIPDRLSTSRIMLDFLLMHAQARDLITIDHDGDLRLTDMGKHFALENNLIGEKRLTATHLRNRKFDRGEY